MILAASIHLAYGAHALAANLCGAALVLVLLLALVLALFPLFMLRASN